MKGSCVGLPSLSWNPPNTMQNFHLDGTGVGRKRGHQVIVAGQFFSMPNPSFSSPWTLFGHHPLFQSSNVRLKRYLEMRVADGGPWRWLCALPAFWVGLLYDEVSLQNVLDMIADWPMEEREMLRNKVPKTGLKTPFRDGLLWHVAQDVMNLAKDGLERRGFKKTGFLNEVAEVVRTGVTPTEKLLE